MSKSYTPKTKEVVLESRNYPEIYQTKFQMEEMYLSSLFKEIMIMTDAVAVAAKAM